VTFTQYERTPEIAVRDYESVEAHRLEGLWETKPGLYGWLSTVDHKEIGIRYIVTAFLFLLAGGIEALIFRLQLAGPELRLLTPEQYDELFTMHGITMILWYAFPVLTGFSVFLQPLIIGSRDMAFPSPIGSFSFPACSCMRAWQWARRPTRAGSTTRRMQTARSIRGSTSTFTPSRTSCSDFRRPSVP
jgi:Cytochrome C and Quinol oxidase polypeptide I